MLQNIRDNASGTAAKVIVGLIALTFVVTGVQFVSFSGEPEVAVVNDQPITENDFLRELDTQRRQLLSLVQDPALIEESLLRSRVLDSLIQETAVLTEAQSREISFGDAQVDVLLTQAPEFQQDGQFSPALFDQFVARQGLGRLAFREQLKNQLAVNQWTQGLADSSFVVPSQVQQALALESQVRQVSWEVVSAEQIELTQVPSQNDLQALYDQSPARWQQAASMTADYVLLARDQNLDEINVDEAEVRDAYERYVQSLSESQETRASHILLTGDDSLEQAQAALSRLNAGESFESLAAELSQDPLSGEQGGDLGFADPSSYVPEFAEALNRLSVGEVSEPVQTPFGHHIIKLTEARTQEPESFDEQADRLRRQLAQNAASIQYQADAEELANIAFSGDLEEAAEVLGLQIQTTEPFTQDQGQGIAENLSVRVTAFGEEVQAGENSALVELDEGVVVLRMRDFEPARQLSLDEVRDQLAVVWQAERRAQQAADLAQQRLADLSGAESLELTRTSDALPSEIVLAAFALAQGQPSVVSANNGDAYALEVTAIEQGEMSDPEGMQAFLASQARQAAGRALGSWAAGNARVER
ncbi:MAG: SurA N-terminal domain-containing protein [Litorivicinus sp.]